MKTAKTINKITPVELVLVEYTDGEYRNEKALVLIDADFDELDPKDPKFREAVKVLDVFRDPPGQWKNISYTSKWFAEGLNKLLKESNAESNTESSTNSMA